MSEKQPRPGQATLAAALITGGSVVLILAAGQRISWLHTIEGQDALQGWIDSQSVDGFTVDGVSTVLRVLSLVGGGAAAAAAILGLQVLRRAAGARTALAVLAPLLLVGGLAIEAFLAPLVIMGIVLLWLQPTRDWYAGRPWVQAYEQRRAARLSAARSSSPAAPAADPFAAPAPPAHERAAHPPVPGHQPSGAPLRPARLERGPRPGGLTAACVLAWVTSTTVVVGLALMALGVGQQSDEIYADMQRQQPELMESYGLSEQDLVASVYVVLAGFLVWALVALVLAGLTFVGHNWARITLAVSAVCAASVVVLACVAAPALVVLLLLLALDAWLLLRSDVARWFRA